MSFCKCLSKYTCCEQFNIRPIPRETEKVKRASQDLVSPKMSRFTPYLLLLGHVTQYSRCGILSCVTIVYECERCYEWPIFLIYSHSYTSSFRRFIFLKANVLLTFYFKHCKQVQEARRQPLSQNLVLKFQCFSRINLFLLDFFFLGHGEYLENFASNLFRYLYLTCKTLSPCLTWTFFSYLHYFRIHRKKNKIKSSLLLKLPNLSFSQNCEGLKISFKFRACPW